MGKKLKSLELFEQMQAKWVEVQAIRDRVVEESREFTQAEKDKIEVYLDEVRGLEVKRNAALKDESLSTEIKRLDEMFSGSQGDDQGSHGGLPVQKTIGARFVESEEWKGWIQAMGGKIPESAHGLVSPPVHYKDLLRSLMRKELITGASDASAGAFVETDYTGIYEPIGRYALNLLQLVNRRETTSDLVHFVRQTYQVTQAAPVQEANVTDYSGATGEISGEKPEGTSRWDPVTTPVESIAVWIPATKRALADVGQLRGLIDQELRDDLNEELEDQIINGNGVGANFTGIMNTAGVLLQAWNTDIFTTTRQAITNMLLNGRSRPTAWGLNPQDWETVELTQDTNGRYYYAGPQNQGPPTLWGVPVAQSQTIVQGTGILGDWRKAVIWDREDASIQVSDSHADFFIRNLVAILAELRAAFGVIRPSGFVILDMEAGT